MTPTGTVTKAETPGDTRRKNVLYGGIVSTLVVLDVITKWIVERSLELYRPVEILGDYVRFTYIYNRGAAFGLSLGEYSRYIFLILTLVAVGVLFSWFRTTPWSDRLRLVAIAMVTGGALGNLIDRVRHAHGVVDFLDVGFGTVRWPVFNIADVGVTVGAVLLAVSLWREEMDEPADD